MPSFSKYKTRQGWRWMFKLELGTDPETGKRRNTTRRGFLKKPDAEEACDRLKEQLKHGDITKDRTMIVNELFEKWIQFYESSGKHKPQTIIQRRDQAKRLLKHFGYIRVKDVTHFAYQTFIFELKNKDSLSKNTISGIHAVGSMMFRFAIREKVIIDSPADKIDMPAFPVKLKEVENIANSYLEQDEIDVFLDSVRKDKRPDMYNFFFVLIWTGVRIGELIALKWKDINFKYREISIQRTHVAKMQDTTLPKTKKSIRKISVEPEVINVLNTQHVTVENLAENHPALTDNEFVFPRLSGEQIGQRYSEHIIEHTMDKAMSRTNIEKHLTPHKLRHTHASLLAEAGVSLEDIKARLGHKDDEITEQIYTHVTKNRRRDASEKFGHLMRKRG